MSERTAGGRLQLIALAKRYDQTSVLEGIDLAVEDGEFLTILGPSGSGKTTILRLIGGFTEPSAGQILFDGSDIAQVPIHRRPFNTVFQDYALFPHMTVGQNVGYGLMVRGVARAGIRARVADALEMVALQDFGQRYPNQLSGGQRQRVALARALICEPKLILLDEPLGALDAELRRQMQEFLKSLQRRVRITFLFVTHDQEEAIAMSDRICVMNQGAIEQVGAPDEIYYRPRTRFVATFFGDNNLLPGSKTTRRRGRDPVRHARLRRSPPRAARRSGAGHARGAPGGAPPRAGGRWTGHRGRRARPEPPAGRGPFGRLHRPDQPGPGDQPRRPRSAAPGQGHEPHGRDRARARRPGGAGLGRGRLRRDPGRRRRRAGVRGGSRRAAQPGPPTAGAPGTLPVAGRDPVQGGERCLEWQQDRGMAALVRARRLQDLEQLEGCSGGRAARLEHGAQLVARGQDLGARAADHMGAEHGRRCPTQRAGPDLLTERRDPPALRDQIHGHSRAAERRRPDRARRRRRQAPGQRDPRAERKDPVGIEQGVAFDHGRSDSGRQLSRPA